MDNKNNKNGHMLEVTSIYIAFIGILCSVVADIDNIYFKLGLSGCLFLSLYIYCIYNDSVKVKNIMFTLLVTVYIVICFVDKSGFLLFTIYFVVTSIEDDARLGDIKRLLLLLMPVLLLIIKHLIYPQKYTLIEIILLEMALLFVGLVFILVDKASWEYENANDKMNLALARAAMNELSSRRLNKELAMKNVLADRNARLEEREKISMNIHNSVGHTITTAIMALDAAEVLYDSEKSAAKDKLIVANSRMHESLTSIRRAVRVLSSKDEIISIEELYDSLIECMRQFELDTNIKLRNNLNSEYQKKNNKYMDAEHGNFMYGALKECLSNGVRHGLATAFIVMAEVDDSHVRVEIQDNGKGLGTFHRNQIDKMFKNGFGLRKIKEYMDNNGGDFSYSGEEGFVVSITLPLVEGKFDAR